jgi:hypothetical protein
VVAIVPDNVLVVTTDPVRAAAVAAVMSFAAEHRLGDVEPAVLADGANLVVHLAPAPVVVKASASTLAIRPDAAEWLAREIDVATHCGRAGLVVVRPSDLVPPGVHVVNGVPLTAWEYVGNEPATPRVDEMAALLPELHGALSSYDSDLPYLGTPLRDIERFLEHGTLPPEQLDVLRRSFEGLRSLCGGSVQALHGDPHPGNLMRTKRGWMWCDFEDTCAGPLEWDLAAVAGSSRIDGPAVMAAYGETGDLQPWLALRWIHVVVWACVFAERLPSHVEKAQKRLAKWLAAAQ